MAQVWLRTVVPGASDLQSSLLIVVVELVAVVVESGLRAEVVPIPVL